LYERCIMHYVTDVAYAGEYKLLIQFGCNRLSSHDVETFKGLDSR